MKNQSYDLIFYTRICVGATNSLSNQESDILSSSLRKIASAWRKIMKKTVITVVGKDSVGIIAKVCTYLANNNINILDISQTIVQGFFNMMMIADTNESLKDFSVIKEELEQIGQELCCDIKMQREDIFDKMHRI